MFYAKRDYYAPRTTPDSEEVESNVPIPPDAELAE